MSKTVTLPLEEYNSLIEFQKEVNNGKKPTCYSRWGRGVTEFYTDSEIIENLTKEINNQNSELKDYLEKNNTLNYKLKTVAKMNIFEFLKWKETNKTKSICGQ